MHTNHILASTYRTIQYIVSFLFHAKFVQIYLKLPNYGFFTVIRIFQCLPPIFMKKIVRSLITGFPLAGYPIIITILPSVQDRITKVTRLLFHDCISHLLSNCDNQTKSAHNIVWGDPVRRQTRFFLVVLAGDQQVITYLLKHSKYI